MRLISNLGGAYVSLETGPSGDMNEGKRQGAGETHLSGCAPLPHQVAGHKKGVDKTGILQHPDGSILKQLQPPPRGLREMQFYSMVYAEGCHDPYLLELQCYLPQYYGIWSSPDAPEDLYLKLEDVTRRFNKPCIMDVKIGQKSYDPYASLEKRREYISKYPLMEEIGFLILGMRIYQASTDSYETYDQYFGRNLVKDTVKDGLARFFYNGNCLRKDAIAEIIQKVQKILSWFEDQRRLHFYASSLLFVYEGSPEWRDPNIAENSLAEKLVAFRTWPTMESNSNVNTKDTMSEQSCSLDHLNANDVGAQMVLPKSTQNSEGMPRCASGVEVRMIDFAHIFPSENHDEGYIFGLKNLLLALQQILHE